MLKRLFRKSPPVPKLIIAQRVIDKMQIAANTFVEDETGEAMIGLITQSGEARTLIILDTISPDDSAVRQLHTFQQGDDLQDEILWWWQENWGKNRRGRGRNIFQKRADWDVPLSYLGDWHKQPGNMIVPSGGDLQTALDWLDDPENHTDFLLVPIVTLDHPATVDPDADNVNYVVVPQGDGSALRVDWWYVHRDWGMFQPITPSINTDDTLPKLSPIPWHLRDQDYAQTEWNMLEDGGFAITVLLADIDDNPPLEVCISAARLKGAEKIYLLTTAHDYPHTPPQMRLAPFVSLRAGQTIADVFSEWWRGATPAQTAPDFIWSTEMHLLDYIQAVEAHMGINIPAPEVPQDVTQQAPVSTSTPEETESES